MVGRVPPRAWEIREPEKECQNPIFGSCATRNGILLRVGEFGEEGCENNAKTKILVKGLRKAAVCFLKAAANYRIFTVDRRLRKGYK
uniref:Uncharacterized protein n=1 Tax=Pristionchus pacificus TaxID=54126 RepID=A0A2A6BUZ0_PRIPA|eukprot:PDM69719.1 hypothetical protein PRIPAC_44815 [Pristionchus pacificus]